MGNLQVGFNTLITNILNYYNSSASTTSQTKTLMSTLFGNNGLTLLPEEYSLQRLSGNIDYSLIGNDDSYTTFMQNAIKNLSNTNQTQQTTDETEDTTEKKKTTAQIVKEMLDGYGDNDPLYGSDTVYAVASGSDFYSD